MCAGIRPSLLSQVLIRMLPCIKDYNPHSGEQQDPEVLIKWNPTALIHKLQQVTFFQLIPEQLSTYMVKACVSKQAICTKNFTQQFKHTRNDLGYINFFQCIVGDPNSVT